MSRPTGPDGPDARLDGPGAGTVSSDNGGDGDGDNDEVSPGSSAAHAGSPRPEADLARAFLARAHDDARRLPPGAGPSRRRRPARARPAAAPGWSGPRADERDPQPLGSALERLADQHGWGSELAVHGVVARWAQVVGADIAAHCHPERYAECELTVRTDSTAWATQLRLLLPTLQRRLDAELGRGTVSRVVVLGPAAPSWVRGPRRVRGRGPRDTYG